MGINTGMLDYSAITGTGLTYNYYLGAHMDQPAVASPSPGVFYFAAAVGTNIVIRRSIDYGATWEVWQTIPTPAGMANVTHATLCMTVDTAHYNRIWISVGLYDGPTSSYAPYLLTNRTGAWVWEQVLGAMVITGSPTLYQVSHVIDSQGLPHVLWLGRTSGSSGWYLLYRYRTNPTTWSALISLVSLTNPSFGHSGTYTIDGIIYHYPYITCAFAGDGRIHILYTLTASQYYGSLYGTRYGDQNNFGILVPGASALALNVAVDTQNPIGGGGQMGGPQAFGGSIIPDPDTPGDCHIVVCSAFNNGTSSTRIPVYRRYTLEGNALSAPVNLGYLYDPQPYATVKAVMDRAKNLHVLALQTNGSGYIRSMKYYLRTADGTWYYKYPDEITVATGDDTNCSLTLWGMTPYLSDRGDPRHYWKNWITQGFSFFYSTRISNSWVLRQVRSKQQQYYVAPVIGILGDDALLPSLSVYKPDTYNPAYTLYTGTTNSVLLIDGAPFADGQHVGRGVLITSGAAAGKIRNVKTVTANNGAGRSVVEVDEAFATALSPGDTFKFINAINPLSGDFIPDAHQDVVYRKYRLYNRTGQNISAISMRCETTLGTLYVCPGNDSDTLFDAMGYAYDTEKEIGSVNNEDSIYVWFKWVPPSPFETGTNTYRVYVSII